MYVKLNFVLIYIYCTTLSKWKSKRLLKMMLAFIYTVEYLVISFLYYVTIYLIEIKTQSK